VVSLVDGLDRWLMFDGKRRKGITEGWRMGRGNGGGGGGGGGMDIGRK